MKNLICILATMAVMVIFVGCATVSKEDCLVADWFEIGRMDARQGKPRTVFQNRAKACLKHGVQADRQAYYVGHDKGLAYYCTDQRGFELGRQGQSYRSVCPPQLEQDFRAGYERGIRSYCSEQKGFELGKHGKAYPYVCPPELEQGFRIGYDRGREIYKYESKIHSLQMRLKHIEKQIKVKEKALYSANLSHEKRAEIRSEVKSLDLEYREVSRELKYMEKTKPFAQVF